LTSRQILLGKLLGRLILLMPLVLTVLAVFTLSAAVAGLIAKDLGPGFSAPLLKADLVTTFSNLGTRNREIKESVSLLGLIFILSASLLVGARCGTSVGEEKRRNTWDDLLLTAQTFRQITTGKMWGVLQATVPYIMAYALPVFIFASPGGAGALLIAGLWVCFPAPLCSAPHLQVLTW
jgi:hypothetical protein